MRKINKFAFTGILTVFLGVFAFAFVFSVHAAEEPQLLTKEYVRVSIPMGLFDEVKGAMADILIYKYKDFLVLTARGYNDLIRRRSIGEIASRISAYPGNFEFDEKLGFLRQFGLIKNPTFSEKVHMINAFHPKSGIILQFFGPSPEKFDTKMFSKSSYTGMPGERLCIWMTYFIKPSFPQQQNISLAYLRMIYENFDKLKSSLASFEKDKYDIIPKDIVAQYIPYYSSPSLMVSYNSFLERLSKEIFSSFLLANKFPEGSHEFFNKRVQPSSKLFFEGINGLTACYLKRISTHEILDEFGSFLPQEEQ